MAIDRAGQQDVVTMAVTEQGAMERVVPENSRHWGRQLVAVFGLEMRRLFTARNTVGLYIFAVFSVLPFLLFGLVEDSADKRQLLAEFANNFAQIYVAYFLRVLTFLGVASVFSTAFREDLLHKTLHYYLLVPVPRWLMVIGKYFASLLLSAVIVGGAAAISFLSMMYVSPNGGLERILFQGGWVEAARYFGISSLACACYGALFLVLGLMIRNVAYPTVILIGWEFINFLLPPFLKNFSFVYHLQSLSPVPIHEGPFALMAEPTPVWLAISGLIIVSIFCVVAAAVRLRTFEVRYDDRE